MTAEWDELRRLVEELPDDEVAYALRAVRRRHERAARPWPPPWFGSVHDTPPDFTARSEELLEGGFGR